ncbi:MAG: tetratricopeptide repeat protein [Limnobacter sp.]|nr:tetratricopeptide repeat protein [Limnobacter sp.]
MQQKNFPEATQHLQQALAADPASVRACLMLGEIYFAQGQFQKALEQWRTAEDQNPWYLPLIGRQMWEAFLALGQEQAGIEQLDKYCQQYPSIDLLMVLVNAVETTQGKSAAFDLLRAEVRKRPSLLGLDKLLEWQLAGALEDERIQDLALIRELIARHTQRLERYRCQSCGFQAKQFYWQCPGCAHWDSIVPRRSEELDFYPVAQDSKKAAA